MRRSSEKWHNRNIPINISKYNAILRRTIFIQQVEILQNIDFSDSLIHRKLSNIFKGLNPHLT